MAYEDLIKSIESAAEEKKQEVLRNADREVEAILREAETESSAIHAQYLEKAKRDLILENNRQKFLAKQEVKKRISFFFFFIRSDPSYPALYERLTREVISALAGEEIILHIDPADSKICSDVLKKTGIVCEIMQDITTIGGLSGTSADGRIRAYNTLESRMERIRDTSTLEIINLILGGPDG